MSLDAAILKEFQKLGIEPVIAHEKAERISTGSLILDWGLGGGLPRGRFIELYGFEATGKSTTCQVMIAGVLENDPSARAVLFDMEDSYTVDWAEKTNIDTSRLVLVRSSHAERTLDQVISILEADAARLIIIDSIPGLITKAEMEGTLEDNQVAGFSRIASRFFPKAKNLLTQTGSVIVMVNQMRDIIGASKFQNPYTTPGGKAKNHWYSARIETLSRKIYMPGTDGKIVEVNPGSVEDEEKAVAHLFRMKTVKNKTAPLRQNIDIRFSRIDPYGVDNIPAITTLGKKMGLFTRKDGTAIEKGNATWHFNGDAIGSSEKEVHQALALNEELYERCYSAVKSGINL